MRRQLLAAALGLLAALLLAEGGLRLIGLEARWLEDLAYWQSVDPEVHRVSADPELLFELRPGSRHAYGLPEGPNPEPEHRWWSNPRVVDVNELGHRGPARRVEKEPGTFRVMALGGSNTYGAAVSNGETWPDALEAQLLARSERPVEVWNLGVSAYVSLQKIAAARRALRDWEPDLLLFQMSNTGPRNLLRQPEVRAAGEFARQPMLWRETILFRPEPGSALAPLFERSHLVRSVSLLRNRRARLDAKGRYGNTLPAIDVQCEGVSEAAFRRFLAEDLGDVPAVLVYPAEGGSSAWVNEIDLPLIDLSTQPDVPGTVDGRHIHPGAAVYRWYGRRIADYLLTAGCLEAGCDFSYLDPDEQTGSSPEAQRPIP